MKALLVRWLIMTLAFVLAGSIVPGFHVASPGAAFLAAVVLSLLNAFVRPVLLLLTLPINILTLGLFTFIINGLMIYMVAGLLKGFSVSGFGAALVGSLVVSIISTLLNMLVRSSS